MELPGRLGAKLRWIVPLSLCLILGSFAVAQAELVAYWPMDSGEAIINRIDGHALPVADPVRLKDPGLPIGREQSASVGIWFNLSHNPGRTVLIGYGTTERGRARGLWLPTPSQLSFFHWGGPDLGVDVGPTPPGVYTAYLGLCAADLGNESSPRAAQNSPVVTFAREQRLTWGEVL